LKIVFILKHASARGPPVYCKWHPGWGPLG